MLIGVVITPLDEEAFNLGGIESAREPMEANGHVVRKSVVVIGGFSAIYWRLRSDELPQPHRE